MGVRGFVSFTNLPLASSDSGDAYCPCGMWLALVVNRVGVVLAALKHVASVGELSASEDSVA